MHQHPLTGLPARVALVAFLTVVLQGAVISQISIFGVSADIAPLVVMSIGLLSGSLAGAVAGFGIGLFIDLVLVQTLGISSLLFIPIGYWAGRFRELRDPSHDLVPLGLGALATAAAAVGMAVLEFLLGVDSPVSGLLMQQIFMTVLINTLIALPVFSVVRWMLGVATDPGHDWRARHGGRHSRGRARHGRNSRGAMIKPGGMLNGGSLGPLQQPSTRGKSGRRS